MPAVIGYWQLPDDEEKFLDFLEASGNVVALPNHWVMTRDELAPQPIRQFVEAKDPTGLSFGLAAQVAAIEIEEHHEDGTRRFSVPYMTPCVIGYRRGGMRNGKLTQSSLSAYYDYPAADAQSMIRKDETFVKWAKKLFAWMRKATPERVMCNGYEYRATKRVRDAVVAGQIEVALY